MKKVFRIAVSIQAKHTMATNIADWLCCLYDLVNASIEENKEQIEVITEDIRQIIQNEISAHEKGF